MNLRGVIYSDGFYLVMWQALGILTSVGFLLSRITGPRNFGIYSAGPAIENYVFMVVSLGVWLPERKCSEQFLGRGEHNSRRKRFSPEGPFRPRRSNSCPSFPALLAREIPI
jgi:hypothetical protein